MRRAIVIKEKTNWICKFEGKKGVSQFTISDKGLINWLDQNIENPAIESEVMIPENTQVTELIYNDKKFFKFDDTPKPEKEPMKNQTNTKSQEKSNTKYARSPYNFIPLNGKVANYENSEVFFDKYDSKKLSGYIEVGVKNLTPLFIRQVSGEESNFGFGNNYGIPGSSFRGMIRTMCEIISFGKFGRFDDYHLYYRQMFGDSELAKQYRSELSIKYDSTTRVSNSEALFAGWLKEIGGKEFIFPAKSVGRQKKGYERYTPVGRYQEFTFTPNSDYALFTTGKMNNKKYGYKFFKHPQDITPVPVSPEFTKAYKNDVNRDEKIDKFYKNIRLNHPDLGIPVFYKAIDGQVVHYGHTMNYRLPYKKSIGDHIPSSLKKSNISKEADLVQKVFGDSFDDKMIASRLAFGDLISNNAKIYDIPALIKILASPKPTTFQHYLEQGEDTQVAIKNWNSDTNIRGFKMYWHRKTSENGTVDLTWKESTTTEKTKSHTEKVKPVKPGANFTGKIWFQNLSKIELGLILAALEPLLNKIENEQLVHKIGLAKPLGFGSIEVKIAGIKIFNLCKEGYFSTVSMDEEKLYRHSVSIDELKKEFTEACSIALNLDTKSIWETPRMIELKTMMTWKDEEMASIEWLNKTRYMEITRGQIKNSKGEVEKKGVNEFVDKPLLTNPSTFKKLNINQFVNGDKNE